MERTQYIQWVGTRVRQFRTQKNLSLDGLATMSGISKKHLGELERGRGNPTLEVVEKVAGNLGVPVEELLNADGSKGREEKLKELAVIIENMSDDQVTQLFRVVKALIY